VTTSSGACRAARATDSRSRLPAGVSALLEPGGIGRPNTSSMVLTSMNYHFVNMLLRLRNLALDSSKTKTKFNLCDTYMEVEDFCRKAQDLISKAWFGRPITSHVSKVIQIFMKVIG